MLLDEDTNFQKLRKDNKIEEDHETPRGAEVSKRVRNEVEEHIPEDRGMTGPQRPE